MESIIRTPSRAEGRLTSEEKKLMEEVSRKWVRIAMRTDPIEPEKITPAIQALYRAAGTECKRIIIASSPLAMAMAYGAAAWIWYAKKNPDADSGLEIGEMVRRATQVSSSMSASRTAPLYAQIASAISHELALDTYAATARATSLVADTVRDATLSTLGEVTRTSVYEATSARQGDTVLAATRDAMRNASYLTMSTGLFIEVYDAAILGAVHQTVTLRVTTSLNLEVLNPEGEAFQACHKIAGEGGLLCAQKWYTNFQAGNMETQTSAYAEAVRDILKLSLPTPEKYQAWNDCAEHGGPRILHEEFCMVSDFPAQIHRDEQNRLHNANGPSIEWRDGWKLYHIHGVPVTRQIVEEPQTLAVNQIDEEGNAEVRRVMIERLGAEHYLTKSNSKPISRDAYGVLYRREALGDEPFVAVKILNSTPEPDGELAEEQAVAIFGKEAVQKRLDAMRLVGHFVPKSPRFKTYMLRVPPTMASAHEAVAWTFGKTKQTYKPRIET